MKKKSLFLLLLLIFGFYSVSAKTTIHEVEKKNLTLENSSKSISLFDELTGTGVYVNVSTLYEFYDENSIHNIVYQANNSKVYWIKLDSNDTITFQKEIEMTLPLFGGAYYDLNKSHLYIVYGLFERQTSADTVTVAVSKYDKDGELIQTLELPGRETTYTSYSSEGTYGPFSYANPGNYTLAMKGDTLIIYYGRLMYSAHQSSYFLAVDTSNMTHRLDGVWDGLQSDINVSHSMDQRVYVDRDGNIIAMDKGDGNSRGFNLFKTDFLEENSAYLYKFVPFHFREGSNNAWGYNNTYATMGNLIEVEDGYIFVGASEKTLSLDFSILGNYNEPFNLFVQKYKHDFEQVKAPIRDKNYGFYTTLDLEEYNKEIHMLSGSRPTTGNRPTYKRANSNIKLFLNSTNNDYGVKWLTNYSDDSIITGIRNLKIDNGRILVLFEKTDVYSDDSFSTSKLNIGSSKEIYYMILDSNANVIQEPILVPNASMTNEINYLYKDGVVTWTTVVNGNFVINRLKIGDEKSVEEPLPTSISFQDSALYLLRGDTLEFHMILDPIYAKSDITVTSGDSSLIQVVDSNHIKCLDAGTVTVTATSSNGKKATMTARCEAIDFNVEELTLNVGETFQLELVKGKYHNGNEFTISNMTLTSLDPTLATISKDGLITAQKAGTAMIRLSYGSQYRMLYVTVEDGVKGDFSLDGEVTFTDVIVGLRKVFGYVEKTDKDVSIGDLNGNGEVDFTDIIILLRYVFGYITEI